MNTCNFCGYNRNIRNLKDINFNGNIKTSCILCEIDIKEGIIGSDFPNFNFHPLNPLHTSSIMHNCKETHVIGRDGSILLLKRLFAPQQIKEEIIFNHLMKALVQSKYIKPYQDFIKFERDAPWDFIVETNCGKAFNVEVTEFTDSQQSRQINEEKELELKLLSTKKEAKYISIRKAIDYLNLNPALLFELPKGNNKKIVENPLFGKLDDILFWSNYSKDKNNFEELVKTLKKKINKKNTGKENTIVVLDNRSNFFDFFDFLKFQEWVHENKNTIPFKEIFVYTGYFSTDDGSIAEYSIISLGISSELNNALQKNPEVVDNNDERFKKLFTDEGWSQGIESNE